MTEAEKKAKQEEWAERAALKEFDGGMSRDQAEKEASEEVYGKPISAKL